MAVPWLLSIRFAGAKVGGKVNEEEFPGGCLLGFFCRKMAKKLPKNNPGITRDVIKL